MFTQVFANYLYEENKINDDQLKLIIKCANTEKLFLGKVAMNIGLMTAEQVLEVKKLQANSDKPFGQLALDKGYLKEDELDILLKIQFKNDLVLIKILTENNIMDLTIILDEFSKFKTKYDLSESEFESIISNDVYTCLKKVSGIQDMGLFIDYASLFTRMVIRFVDRNCIPKKAYKVNTFCGEYVFYQSYTIGDSFIVGCSATEEVFKDFVRLYSDLDFEHLDDTAIDILKGFLNCVSELVLEGVDSSKESTLTIPKFNKGETLNDVFILPIKLEQGEVTIIFKQL